MKIRRRSLPQKTQNILGSVFLAIGISVFLHGIFYTASHLVWLALMAGILTISMGIIFLRSSNALKIVLQRVLSR